MTAVTREGIPVVEVTPTHVKKCIGGKGSADKEQVSLSLKALIGFERGDLPHDVSDALAIALSFGLTVPMISATTHFVRLESNL
jgi:crossover junction endodeoxyribonuclease RuvC